MLYRLNGGGMASFFWVDQKGESIQDEVFNCFFGIHFSSAIVAGAGERHACKKTNGQKPANNAHSSFPSGHATLAFAAATVYAMEYRDRPLVPIGAYSVASIVCLTRLTENRHWASDLLVGAVLGHLCGKQVVNNYHRYARIKNAQKARQRTTVLFNAQYFNGQILPGVVVNFN